MATATRRRAAVGYKRRYVAAVARGLQRVIADELAALRREIERLSGIAKAEKPKLTRAALKADFKGFEKKLQARVSKFLQSNYAAALDAKNQITPLKFDARKVPEPGIEFDRRMKLARNYIGERKVQLAGMSKGISRNVYEFIQDGAEKGLALEEFAEKLSEKFSNLSANRAFYLAKNEIAIAYSSARNDFWAEQLPGVAKRKVWLPSVGGPYDREWHNEIEDAPFDGFFTIHGPTGTWRARYPNDPSLPPEESINCQCDYEIEFDS